MAAGNVKRQVLYLAISVFISVLIWKYVPLLDTSGSATREAQAGTKGTHGPNAPAGSLLVNVTMVGFDPSVIEAKAGQPLKLAFYRANAENCAREVVFPSLGIRKELPAGQTVVVDITPTKTGPLEFACGMDMLKGKLIVR